MDKSRAKLVELTKQLSPLDKQLLLSECEGWGSWMFSSGNFMVNLGLGTKRNGSIAFDTPLAKELIAHLRAQQEVSDK